MNYGDFTKEFSYTYYKNGLKKTLTMPDGTMYEYSYGSNNELREVRIPGLGAITISDYTWNRPSKMTFPGGTQRTYGYDALMRLNTLTVTDPGGNPLLDYAYTYDPTGNIVTKTTEHGTYGYDYDASSRLISAENPVLENESYTYDNVGNRLTAADVSGTWNYNANNELLGFADVEYDYDDNGNMTQKRVGTAAVNYIYDAANRLVKVEDDATQTVIAEYYYDPFGRRLWKDVGGTKTYFFYSDEGLIGEYDETGIEIRSYGYKPDSTWTTDPLFMKQGAEYYFYQNDHLGTPQKLVGINGAVVWSAVYSSFGEAQVLVETVINNLRLPGQYYDVETGLLYNFQRYYDPKIGRYLRVDPLGVGGGDWNLYGYARNNSMNLSDSLGLWAVFDSKWLPPWNWLIARGDETHDSLTKKAFEGSKAVLGPDITRPLAIQFVRDMLVKGNRGQDFQCTDRIDKRFARRHYSCKTPHDVRQDVRLDYRRYLVEESDRFYDYIGFRHGVPSNKPSSGDCLQALISLGQLSHSWQDYYGHGMTSCPTLNRTGYSPNISCLAKTIPIFVSDSFIADDGFVSGGFIATGAPVIDIGSPANPIFLPSTGSKWDIIGGLGGEHASPAVEPIHAGSRPQYGYDLRVESAIAFTREKFKEYLRIWASQCQCHEAEFVQLFWDAVRKRREPGYRPEPIACPD